MRLRSLSSLSFLLVAYLLAACAAPMGAGRARPLPPGQSEAGFGIRAGRLQIPGDSGTPKSTAPFVDLGASYRRGVADGLELGGTVYGSAAQTLAVFGLAFDTKLRLLASPNPRWGLDLALAPRVGYREVRFLGGATWRFASLSLPLLVGHDLGPNQLVWGPRLGWEAWWGDGPRVEQVLTVGGSVGFAWRVVPGWDVMPEVAVTLSPFAVKVDGTARRGLASTSFTLGVAKRF